MKKANVISFKPGLWPTLATLVLLPVLLALGFWQLDRAAEKRELLAEFQARSSTSMQLDPEAAALPRFQRVMAQGRYLDGYQFFLDAMPGTGGAGFHVLSILQTADSDVGVVVNRGWVPSPADRNALPTLPVPPGEQLVSGWLDRLPRPGLELDAKPQSGWPRLVLFPVMAELESAAGIALYPLQLRLDANRPGGYERNWQPVGSGPRRHTGYAVQWFALATALLVIYLVVNLHRGHTDE